MLFQYSFEMIEMRYRNICKKLLNAGCPKIIELNLFILICWMYWAIAKVRARFKIKLNTTHYHENSVY